MKIEIKTIYRCGHCGKTYFVKNACENHEERCVKNPENRRPCYGCDNIEKVKTTYCVDYYGVESDRDVEVLYCKKIDSYVYPPSVECKGNALELEKDNICMPKECEFKIEREYC